MNNPLSVSLHQKDISTFDLSLLSTAAIYTLLVGILYWWLTGQPVLGIDDANIYMVYMRNLAEGHGFVYNPGGEHVEGFTSLLWTLFGGLVYWLMPEPELSLLFCSFMIVIGTIYQLLSLVNAYTKNGEELSIYNVLVLGCLAVIPGYFDWTLLTLMETGWWSFLLIAIVVNISKVFLLPTVEQLKRQNNWLFLSIVLLILTRPESLLWGLIFIAIRIFQVFYVQQNWKQNIPEIIKPIMAYGLTVAGLTTWRLSYFGYPFPNTYYAKVSADIFENMKVGSIYLFQFLLNGNPLVLIILLIGLYWVIQQIKSKNIFKPKQLVLLTLLLITVINLLLPIYTGGDHFALFRFYQPLLPIAYVFFALVLFDFFKSKKLKLNPSLLIIGIIGASLLPTNRLYAYIPKMFVFHKHSIPGTPLFDQYNIVETGRAFSERLNRFFESASLPTYGIFAAGGMAYNYDGISIDLLGLNNVAMAHADKIKRSDAVKNHASFNKNVFYQLAPEMMHLWTSFVNDRNTYKSMALSDEADKSFEAKIFQHIYKDEKFKQLYHPVFITNKKSGDVLHTYLHKDFITKLPKSIYDIQYVFGEN